MENALKNTKIASSLEYTLTLKSFFKNEFQYANDCYLIPFRHVLYTKRQIFMYIHSSCGITCKNLTKCHGHQFLDFIELIYTFNRYCIMERNVYFEYFLFKNFELTSNGKMTLCPVKIKSWQMVPVHKFLINKGFTYSQKLSFLR